MKANKILGIIALAAILTQGCQKQPTACFTASDENLILQNNTSATVDFSNCSTEAHSYEWDFGDGSKSTLPAPSKTYQAGGTYTVTMKAISKNGKKSDEMSKTITVTEYGGASFTYYSFNGYYPISVAIGSITRAANPDATSCNYDFFLPSGTYNYTATEQSPGTHTWSGTVTINTAQCVLVQLF